MWVCKCGWQNNDTDKKCRYIGCEETSVGYEFDGQDADFHLPDVNKNITEVSILFYA